MEKLEAEFSKLGMEVYSQNFSAVKPVSIDSEVRSSVFKSLEPLCLGF